MANWNFNQQCGSSSPFEVLITDVTTGEPIDLTGATAEWIFAKRDAQGNPTIAIPALHYTTENDKLTVGSDGIIRGELLPDDTVGVATAGKDVTAAHMMFLTLPDGEPMLVQQGTVTFTPKLPTE